MAINRVSSLNKFLSYVNNVDKWKLMHRECSKLLENDQYY